MQSVLCTVRQGLSSDRPPPFPSAGDRIASSDHTHAPGCERIIDEEVRRALTPDPNRTVNVGDLAVIPTPPLRSDQHTSGTSKWRATHSTPLRVVHLSGKSATLADPMGITPTKRCPISLLRVLGPSIPTELQSLADDLFSLRQASRKRPRIRSNSPHMSLGGGGLSQVVA